MRRPRQGGDALILPRALGRTGILVPALGLGCGPLGGGDMDEAAAEHLVRGALDLGVTLFDTAPSYGDSEARLGRALAGRRHEASILTKGGYGVPGCPDWTPECIARGIDQALARLGTDHLEAFVLHSCPRDVLARGDLLEPLVRARAAGKVRAIGYSGDGDALAAAVRMPELDLVECSVNVVDQEALARSVPVAAESGKAVLAKRALANAVCRLSQLPEREDRALYWRRYLAMFPELEDDRVRHLAPDVDELVRFAAHAPGVTSALVGTRSLDNLRALARAVLEGPLDADAVADVQARFARHGQAWPGLV